MTEPNSERSPDHPTALPASPTVSAAFSRDQPSQDQTSSSQGWTETT
jgi:hypothetical protein